MEHGEVDSPEGRHVDSLSLGVTTLADSRGVFSGSDVSDGVDDGLQRVFASGLVDDFQRVLDDPDGLRLLTSVSSLEHEAADQSFDDGAERLPESSGLVSAGGVRHEDLALRVLHSDVVLESGVGEGDAFVGPPAEESRGRGEGRVFQFYVIDRVRLMSSVIKN